MENKYYKVKALHLVRKDYPKGSEFDYQEEINFQRANMTLLEKVHIVSNNISNFLYEESFNNFDSRFSGNYINDSVPEYMILEERPLGLYEILTNTLIVREDEYFKGSGIYIRGYEKTYAQNLDVVPGIMPEEKILIPVDVAGIGATYREYNDLKMSDIAKKFIVFRKEAKKVLEFRLQRQKEKLEYNEMLNDFDEEVGKAIIKKYNSKMLK